ncbi:MULTISPECIES: purine-cytosine permease family protein [Brenneria]|uniref:Allantoin permease n=1 Tax=Brenneria nigrifluens DSM 30175 = ATCC 13028 TaxID=1121120 RepID=A0A2U1UP23_9GAMM|nr:MULTISPECIES: cytosine permease [Brenneria]EHD23400.1 permease for cytosine/purines uracil thiamine allantoin [Brenneria sp. EniD312]PWC23429.1 allantoin permease [Brenneria nigrifluens] [Brenneria nigrifluens DSM 30175 = ATCC 13028]QCR07048.1 allantoin permease [Brenneria nigrifluens] [Brenneria nigrifluens DSM 30175 = ATCC 13028]
MGEARQNLATQPQKKVWKVESTGIDLVPEAERTGRPLELFWIWCAANIGILGIVYGAIIVSFGLSFIQSILAAILGVVSFALVGFTSFAGQIGRTATLTLSRTIFGVKGNIAPTAFSWFNLMGWEAVNLITGTLTLSALFEAIGLSGSHSLTAVCLLLFGGLTIAVSILGQNTLVLLQSWITRIFGTMTLVVVIYILFNTPWHKVLSLPSGDWLSGFLPAVSVIAAGTGVGWTIAGADYSRYQNPSSGRGRVFAAVVGGAVLPLVLLMLAGILLSSQLPELASSANPIALIGTVLPPWMSVPYLLTATAGIVTIAVLSLYSAGLNLLTIGVKLRQPVAVALDAVLVVAIAVYVLFISGDFLTPFISFLIFCGLLLGPWSAMFILDYLLIRRHYGYDQDALFGLNGKNRGVRWGPLFCWLLGAISGLMVTKTGFIDGPLALGIFADSSLGLFVAFGVSLVAYWLYLLVKPQEKRV